MHSLVSVVIPAFNAGDYLNETLNSVIEQSHANLEIIVVDDGSTDATSQILNKVRDPRLKILRTTGCGAGYARNAGLRVATGDWVQFLDADDILSPDKIALQLTVLLSAAPNAVASCAWAKFGASINNVKIRPEVVWKEADPVRWLTTSLNGGGMMQTACWLTPRQIIEKVGFWNESLSLHDDGEYFCRVLLASDHQIFVDGPLVFYRTVENSLSRQRNRKAIESAFQVCELRDGHLSSKSGSIEVNRAIATQYAQFAYEFCRAAPDLAARAVQRISNLRTSPANCIGGNAFRRLVRVLGWITAFRVRSAAARYKTSLSQIFRRHENL